MRVIMLLGLIMMSSSVFSNDSSHKEVVRLSPPPKMRAVDRDWEYFKAVPCKRIKSEVFHSRSEEILIAKRKSQCKNQYNAFFTKPVDQ